MGEFTVGCFNSWSGSLVNHDPSPLDYICFQASHHDVLSLQEVHWSRDVTHPRYQDASNPGSRVGPIDTQLGNMIHKRLKSTHHVNFIPHFPSAAHDCEPNDNGLLYGNLMLVKKTYPVIHYSTSAIHGDGNLNTEVRSTGAGLPGCRRAQWVTIMTRNNQPITIVNVHGLWSKFGKIDLSHRNRQSKQIIDYTSFHQSMTKLPHPPPVLITGDFNYTSKLTAFSDLVNSPELFPEGGVDLNEKFAITDTRTTWYKKDIREADFMICGEWFAKHCSRLITDPLSPSDHRLLSAVFRLI